jgi:hypothetical protein
MKSIFMKSCLILLVILSLGLYLAPMIKQLEGFKAYNFPKTDGDYPQSVDRAILNDYPQIGKNQVSTYDASEIWWHYPIFTLPSFKQQTNNLQYYNNPDEGTCMPAEFCGAVYHSKKNKSNEIYPLPPASQGPGARVGYFRTEPNMLYYSIPTNENILY